MKRNPTTKHNDGFTIFELLVWAMIVGVLASILLPALARAREHGRVASCAMNLQQLGMALRMYANEHDSALPWSGGGNDASCLNILIEQYVPDKNLFMCPSNANGTYAWRDRRNPPQFPYDTTLGGEVSLRGSYDYFPAYTSAPIRHPRPEAAPPRIPIMWDYDGAGMRRSHMTASNVLLLDGSVSLLLAKEWSASNLPLRIQLEGVSYVEPASQPAMQGRGWR